MLEKILIANRGEIALRIIRTCREMGIRCAAVYAPVDRDSVHTLAADEAVALADDEPARSYLDQGAILAAARATGAQAIHPGYGFLAENADFAQACADAGLTFIGPPADALRAVGDKTEARRLASAASVPVIPGSAEPTSDPGALAAEADGIGLPVMLKAAAGGGGKGMRRVDSREELAEAVRRASNEAQSAFGDGRIYLERCIQNPRHVEVQVLADSQGRAVHLFERECSIQRRHQKIVEEAPSTALDEDLRAQICAAALRVARESGYQNAGTVEFLLEPGGAFYFMEVNARLQVEHPVTEAICGLDLVRQQIQIAAGEPLGFDQESITRRGHAIECRIYAEDPRAGFLPSPGRVLYLHAPAGPGIRFDCGVEAGSQVPVHYDPILAKLIAWGAGREAALARMARALAETAILGVDTDIELLLDIVSSETFRQGRIDTGFLERHFPDWRPDPARLDALLLGWLAAEAEGLTRAESQARQREESSVPGIDPWRTLGRWRMED
ncbi:MAG: acetyl-CoA carboxylase biotin carboxylase subunit [Deltaproteobacteria bacterium]|nr:acetyl-CoA carboxylase biotin carboxylase subunit [Deltaproteobacteria bacterium]